MCSTLPEDVECHVFERESPVYYNSSRSDSNSQFLWPIGDDYYNSEFIRNHLDCLFPFTAHLGQPITTSRGNGFGSSGVYLRLVKDETEKEGAQSINTLITCRHVLCDLSNNAVINRFAGSPNESAPIQVHQVHNPKLDKILERVDSFVASKQRQLDQPGVKALGKMGQSEAPQREDKKTRALRRRYKAVRRDIAYAWRFREHCKSHSATHERYIGDVIASPPICEDDAFHHDWALVGLDDATFQGILPSNRIYVGYIEERYGDWLELTGQTFHLQDCQHPEVSLESKDFLEVTHFATKKDLRLGVPEDLHSRDPMIEPEREELGGNGFHRVFKNGATSGGTHGSLNNLPEFLWLESGLRTQEYLVVSDNSKPFSAPGDSGSLVFTVLKDKDSHDPPRIRYRACAVGLLWGGLPGSSMLTYVTPFDTLKERIERFLPGWHVDFPQL
ncbi:hypothetical protein GGR53DRAFT_512817 [Hypoxylon sp. FL1150]|nr:hypothetical protein GGR53DRAFT_512817 [Hypoxylon sp. FL1150]